MSRRKDLERALAGGVIRHGTLKKPLFFRCSKCGVTIVEAFVEEHINKCHHGKAECGKCNRWIDAADFLKHYQDCPGKPKQEALHVRNVEKSGRVLNGTSRTE
jgi:methionyl-tRNA synthetase